MNGIDLEAIRRGFANLMELSRVTLECQRRERARRTPVSSAADLVAYFHRDLPAEDSIPSNESRR